MRLLLLVLLCLPSLAAAETFPVRDGVNAIIGDDSYVARFGTLPGPDAGEQLRLRVHLEYVEELLRAADTSGLSPELQRARARNLDLLRAYHRAGVFPKNHSVAGRRPHFIDEAGRICAVGYLIEQTAGRAAAEAINTRHEWSYLWEIDGADAWIASSGLTVRELAMIQPGYDFERPRPIDPPRPPPPPIEEPEERVRQTIVARINNASFDVQACANAIGLKTSGKLEIKVDVARNGVLTPRIARLESDALSACLLRATASKLGRYSTRNRLRPMTVVHKIPVAKSAGTALDREAIGTRLRDAVTSTCRASGELRARFAVDPSGRIDLVEVTSTGDLDRTACTRQALVQAERGFFGFRGKRTEVVIDLK